MKIKQLLNKIFHKKKKIIYNNEHYIYNVLVIEHQANDELVKYLKSHYYMFFITQTTSLPIITVYNIALHVFKEDVIKRFDLMKCTLYTFNYSINKIQIFQYNCNTNGYYNTNVVKEEVIDDNCDVIEAINGLCNFQFQFFNQSKHITKILDNRTSKYDIAQLLSTSMKSSKSERQRMMARQIIYHF